MFRTSFIIALACVVLAPRADAHAVGTSYLFAYIDEAGGPARLRWEMNANELAWNVFIDGDADGTITQEELDRAKSTLAPAIDSQLVVTRGAIPCALAYDGALVRPVDEHAVVTMAGLVRTAGDVRKQLTSSGYGGELYDDAQSKVLQVTGTNLITLANTAQKEILRTAVDAMR